MLTLIVLGILVFWMFVNTGKIDYLAEKLGINLDTDDEEEDNAHES